MKKIFSILLGIIFSVSMAFSPILSVEVNAGVFNEYRHRTYETEEELEQLKNLLLESGYVELVVGSKEYERLANDPSFWYNNFMNPVSARFYTLYVLKSDLEDYMSTSDSDADYQKRQDAVFYLKENIVIISTYELKEQDEGAMEGLMGNDIPDNWKTCLLTVRAEVEDTFTRDIVVRFVEVDTGYRYTFRLQKTNGYDITIKFPSGNYDIESLSCNSDTPVTITYDKPTANGFYEFYTDTAPIMTFKIGNPSKDNNGGINTDNDKITTNIDMNKDNGGGLIESTDENQYTLTPEERKSGNTILLIIEISVILLLVVGGILFIRHLIKKTRGKNDNF